MLEALGEVLPAAAGVALSPFPVVAVVLLLGSRHPTANGGAFAVGWVTGLAALTALVLVLTGDADDPTGDVARGVAWLKVAIGAALVVLAVRKWTGRPRQGDEPEVPGWMASISDVTPRRALLVGLGLGGANPKNVALTVAAVSSISALGLGGSEGAAAAALYVLAASSSVLGLLGVHLVMGEGGRTVLQSVGDFMAANNAVIVMVVLLVLGLSILGEGLAAV